MTGKQKPNWQLSFDISPDPVIGRDGQVHRKATAIAKRGDLAYMAELELVNWSEDIAAFFEQVRSVFFDAEVNGVPEFPDMTGETPREDTDKSEEVPIETTTESHPEPDPLMEEAEIQVDGDDEDYDITFYPAEGSVEDVDTPQPSLW